MYRTCLTIAMSILLLSAEPVSASNWRKRGCSQCRVSAILIVNCPRNAKVFVAGRPTRTCGAVRQYHLNLISGHYSVRIEDDKDVRQELIRLRHGANTYTVRWDHCGPAPASTTPPAETTRAAADRAEAAATKADAAATRADAAAASVAQNTAQAAWPGKIEGLVSHWNGGSAITAGKRGDVKLENGILKMKKGAFLLPKSDNDRVRDTFGGQKKAQQLSVEIVLKSGATGQSGPARILSYSANTNQRNFTLGQEGNELVFRLRTSQSDLNGTTWVTTLKTVLPIDRQLTHVVVTYQAGELIYYVNGRVVERRTDIKGDLSTWTGQRVILGDEWPSGNASNGGRFWNGEVERFAIYKRQLTAFEVQNLYNLMVSE